MTPWLLVTGDFAKTGGMDRANYALAHYLALRGSETQLIAHRVDADLVQFPNVFFHRIPKPLDSYLTAAPLLDRMGRFWAAKVAARGGTVVVNGGNCVWSDVNWVHYVHAAYRRETNAGAAHRIKLAFATRIARASERRALKSARIVITNSDRTRKDLARHLGINGGKASTVYYGIDPQLFRPASNDERAALRCRLQLSQTKPVLGFIGAMGDRRKGFDTLFQAWKILSSHFQWDAELLVIGSGAETPVWVERTRQSDMQGSIHFFGFREDVPQVLRACDATVAPARYEAYGLAVHESLCCGVPAFVSKDAGVAERYPPDLQDLLLSDPEDVDALVRQLLAWRANQDFWRERVLSFSSRLRNYTWNDMARDIVALTESDTEAV